MTKQFRKGDILRRLRKEIAEKRPIIVVAAGIGLTAKFGEIGGADLIVVPNSGVFRMNGHGSSAAFMPFGDSNEMVLEMGKRSILPIVQKTPVIAGLCGTDVTRLIESLLWSVKNAGFSGVMNFPTVAALDGNYRLRLENLGMGYGREVEMIRTAHEMGLFTLSYAYNPGEAEQMAKAGTDVLIAHLGLTAGGSLGSKRAVSLSEGASIVQSIIDAAKKISRKIICLAHGGPISTPKDTEYIYTHTDAVGFLGASSIERIPVEIAIKEATKGFKSTRISKARIQKAK